MHSKKEESSPRSFKSWQDFNKTKKITLLVLILGSILVIFVLFSSIQNNIQSPFLISYEKGKQNLQYIKDENKEQIALEKRTDSDGDGISDWLEKNVYNSSPYLWSTAGDQTPDNIKIALNINPDCKLDDPVCEESHPFKYNLATTTIPLMDALNKNTEQEFSKEFLNDPKIKKIQTEAGIDTKSELQKIIPQDPQKLRQMLIDSGVPTEKLDLLSDDQLIDLVQKSIKKVEQGQASSTTSE